MGHPDMAFLHGFLNRDQRGDVSPGRLKPCPASVFETFLLGVLRVEEESRQRTFAA